MRQLSEYVARASQMPPQILALKIASMITRKVRRTKARLYYKSVQSYSKEDLDFTEPLFASPTPAALEKDWSFASSALEKIMNHEFNLLGSDWVKVAYGAQVPGIEGHKYPSNPRQWSEKDLRAARHINPANRKYAKQVLNNISADYPLIDWQLDFKSGYRWDNDQWWEDIPYAHKPGVDIKVPWELSRMQHLPWLAYAYQKSANPAEAQKYADEFMNQVLDFIANNPPRFGVNWKCPMDVSIRAANWLISFDLFRAAGFNFPEYFEKYLSRNLFDHGLFVVQNFEKGTDFRGNHYLADIAGLSFIAFYLKGNQQVTQWKNLCKKELLAEAEYQFHSCGTNFEGSTAYHRLSSEMLFYPLLLMVLAGEDQTGDFINQNLYQQLSGMMAFSQHVTKPDGNIVQVGDNDSGRFFKLSPAWFMTNNILSENHLDLSHIKKYTEAFFTNDNNPQNAESSIVAQSLNDSKWKAKLELTELLQTHQKTATHFFAPPLPVDLSQAKQTKEYIFELNQDSLTNQKAFFYKEFGLVIFKSEKFFLSFRCGPIGQLGRGGHDHNDQLSIELFANGKSLIQDPGTFLYTALPKERNRYRSNSAHFCPQPVGKEMADINTALFFIDKATAGEVLQFKKNSCTGIFYGFGFPIVRTITIAANEIQVKDYFFSQEEILDLNKLAVPPFSEAYGVRKNVKI